MNISFQHIGALLSYLVMAAILNGCAGVKPGALRSGSLNTLRATTKISESELQDAKLEGYLAALMQRISPEQSVKVRILSSKARGALLLPDQQIVLSLEQFKDCQNEAELAFVLLHEIGHLTLGHGVEMAGRSYSEEVEADIWALNRLAELRWNPYLVEAILERETFRNEGASQAEILGRLAEIRKALSGMPVGKYYVSNSADFVAQQRRIVNGGGAGY